MLNRAPIFVNGFQRGGTNILVNLLLSHPEVCKIPETQIVFYGSPSSSFIDRWMHRALYLPIFIAARQHIFWIDNFKERRPLPQPLLRYVDLLLYKEKFRHQDNRYRSDTEYYTREQIVSSRLLGKNVNAVVLATPVFSQIYPDASFIGIVRNGLALCEGFLRRGWTVERFGKMYARVCEKMIRDASRIPSYQIVRFEDIILDPCQMIPKIYRQAGLNFNPEQKFRLQAKKSMDKDGNRRYLFGGGKDRDINWFHFDQLDGQFRKDVNENQISRLTEEDKLLCLEYIHQPMEYFGYLDQALLGI